MSTRHRQYRPSLAEELGKRSPFACPEQEAYLNLLRTHERLAGRFDRLFRAHGLTQPQYNVLRILRGHEQRSEGSGAAGGAAAGGVSCGVISRELVTHAADVTRLADRLIAAGLAERAKNPADRRVVLVRLTDAGRRVLDELDEPVLALHRAQLAHLGAERLGLLNELLSLARAPHGDDAGEPGASISPDNAKPPQ